MSDRHRVVYKPPLFRFLEFLLVLALALAITSVIHWLSPALPVGIPLAACLLGGAVLVPRVGSELARRRGAELVTPEERSRRHLGEIGPLMPWGRPPMLMARQSASRTGRHRARRG